MIRLPQAIKAEINLIFLSVNLVKLVREITNVFLSHYQFIQGG